MFNFTKNIFNLFVTFQALDLIISILSDTDIQISTVIEYINDAVSLLQMLSDFIKAVIESVSMACQSMKTFPIATSDIILKIFMHCKDRFVEKFGILFIIA